MKSNILRSTGINQIIYFCYLISYWLHLKQDVLHPITLIMVVNKSDNLVIYRSCGLETKSRVLLVWDQDKTELKYGRDRDKTIK